MGRSTGYVISRTIGADRYTTINNDAARDPELSYRAKGLLLFLLSHTSGRYITSKQIMDAATEGRDAIRKAMRELEDAGYVSQIERHKQADGTFTMTRNLSDTRLKRGFSGALDSTQDSADFQATKEEQKNTNIDLLLDLENTGPKDLPLEPVRKPSPKPVDRTDHQVTTTAWESYKQRTGRSPVWSFPGVRKIVGQILKDGSATADELVQVMAGMDAVTTNLLAIELGKHRRATSSPDDQLRQAGYME